MRGYIKSKKGYAMTNVEKIKTTFHDENNVRILSSILKSTGIDYDKLPMPIKKEIGYVKDLELKRKGSEATYKFTGLVAMLGMTGDGQLYLRKRKVESDKEGFTTSPFFCNKMEIFNPHGLYVDGPVIIVPDFLSALKLNSYGMNAISIGNSAAGKYFLPALDQAIKETNVKPEIHFYLPRWNTTGLKRALSRRGIKAVDLKDEISSFSFDDTFSANQLQILRKILPSIELQELPARRMAA